MVGILHVLIFKRRFVAGIFFALSTIFFVRLSSRLLLFCARLIVHCFAVYSFVLERSIRKINSTVTATSRPYFLVACASGQELVGERNDQIGMGESRVVGRVLEYF